MRDVSRVDHATDRTADFLNVRSVTLADLADTM